MDFGFSLITVGSDHLEHGIKCDFPKPISDLCADFGPLWRLSYRDVDHQNQIGNKLFEVFKGRAEILVCSHLSLRRVFLNIGGGDCPPHTHTQERGLRRPEVWHQTHTHTLLLIGMCRKVGASRDLSLGVQACIHYLMRRKVMQGRSTRPGLESTSLR